MFIGQTSAEVGFCEDTGVIDEQRPIDDLSAELNLLLVLFVFAVAERNVPKNSGLHLLDVFLKHSKVF